MGVSYKKLWKLIIDKDMTKAQLREAAGVAPSTFSKMNKNEFVSLEVIVRLCMVLNCDIGDIVEIVK
ncbi:helix-turn-helix transcriptional regulator [Bacillus mycoides]|uniref:helix-turn-helix domain-containing protein n=1 Tax=Bacillus mycoides TaxID=1405 RepID=UPI002DF82DB1|nr:helix-turn-helix transcriptional regulator [Bacillus mycoides]MEC5262850.1 helix-turn-helix transcriptional regulator [Bacillus mycoides]